LSGQARRRQGGASAPWREWRTVGSVTDGPIDLRILFKSLGGFSGQRALESTPIEREKVDVDVELLDPGPVEVVSAPLVVEGFVDGVQASLCLTHREHRPVYLSYMGAGGLGKKARVLGVRERLFVACGSADVEFVEGLGSGIEIEELGGEDPPSLEREAQLLVGKERDRLERKLVTELLEQGAGTLVLDGSLIGRDYDDRLVGVVKSANKQWLDDEGVLYGLGEGWRSPRFLIPGGGKSGGRDRYSCYVQMVDKSKGAWNLGLIRLEAYDPELLDPLAARALAERQGASGGDRRWDRHMASVRAVEEFLRARRPSVFAL